MSAKAIVVLHALVGDFKFFKGGKRPSVLGAKSIEARLPRVGHDLRDAARLRAGSGDRDSTLKIGK